MVYTSNYLIHAQTAHTVLQHVASLAEQIKDLVKASSDGSWGHSFCLSDLSGPRALIASTLAEENLESAHEHLGAASYRAFEHISMSSEVIIFKGDDFTQHCKNR